MLVYDPRFTEHVASPLHVERPERLEAIVARLRKEDLFSDVARPTPATLAEVRRVHRETYVEAFRSLRRQFHSIERRSRDWLNVGRPRGLFGHPDS